jgi:hypothetical protein
MVRFFRRIGGKHSAIGRHESATSKHTVRAAIDASFAQPSRELHISLSFQCFEVSVPARTSASEVRTHLAISGGFCGWSVRRTVSPGYGCPLQRTWPAPVQTARQQSGMRHICRCRQCFSGRHRSADAETTLPLSKAGISLFLPDAIQGCPDLQGQERLSFAGRVPQTCGGSPFQPKPDLLFDFYQREENGTDSRNENSVEERQGHGAEQSLRQ